MAKCCFVDNNVFIYGLCDFWFDVLLFMLLYL